MRHRIKGTIGARYDEVLTPAALDFLVALDSRFAGRRTVLLDARRVRRARWAGGQVPGFRPETAHIREGSWQVAPAAAGLRDRRVEITGPPEPKMAVNALNSGADVWMADFEDATAPTWDNLISGQLTLIDARDRRLDFTDARGKRYVLGDRTATIVVRPRGWHLAEKHVVVDGRPIPASLFDFGLALFHGSHYFYLPKLEDHHEARLWNDVFVFAQHYLGLPAGTIRATVLIETITAAFEMDEILYELREHAAGLNAGRWDYIFSIIKNLGQRQEFVLPDRSAVTMTVPFMRAYTELLVRTCHRRGAYAIGGMSAFIPGPAVPDALDRVRADKQREAADGFDGSWVAHPGLVGVCRAAFAGRVHQLDRTRDDVDVTEADLLAVDKTPGQVTAAGLRANVSVALRYVDAWLGGTGAVALDHLMEDAATAEIARCQVWQWLHHRTPLADGGTVTPELVESIVAAELTSLSAGRAGAAADVFRHAALGEELPAFFTGYAYAHHLTAGPAPTADRCPAPASPGPSAAAVPRT
ncbi:malate synthase A [Catenuloplanes indicus]|uniref:Malate synthase n=1 Tax=Catenuloplanes indicus TaxID=137267 RepID=A0AAE4AWA0_9ACTN|nr:malate synthase A [Catenuloplanes indicus]MDQ0364789.1 malate synthase [Catenuloplanes indicus]